MTAGITASQVKELREATNVGMMECKKALAEANGDMDTAIRLLRERGMVLAGKKADREANEGLVSADVEPGGKLGVIIEVNCETDFVARNETFQGFVQSLVEKAKSVQGSLAEACKEELIGKISEVGENLVIRRNDRFEVQGAGVVASYIHLGGKVGVLVEMGCEHEASIEMDVFKDVVKDITLHIAATNPTYLSRDDVEKKTLDVEREIFAKQVSDKPDNIIEKIVHGKIEKYLAQTCLLEQGFVKEPDQSVSQLLAAKGQELDDKLSIRRFVRYQIGS